MSKVKVDGHIIQLSNLDKILFPNAHITKGDLIEYYHMIAPLMIPHIQHHPVMMHRFPDGINHEGFYQKDISDYFPGWIKSKGIAKKSGQKVFYVVINNAATLVYLANQACITPHLLLSTTRAIKRPDRIIFDLDPSPGVSFAKVRWAAYLIKETLESYNLPSFVMTTGSKGLHIMVPLKQQFTFDRVYLFAHNLAYDLVTRYPDLLTMEMIKKRRGNRILIDVWRNQFGSTAVAPYSVRALEGAPIATPILWQEVDKIVPQKYTIKNIHKRIEACGDIWLNAYKKLGVLPDKK